MIVLAVVLIGAALLALASALGLLDRAPVAVEADGSGFGPAAPPDASWRVTLGGLITPKPLAQSIERNLVLAGRPRGWTVSRIVGIKAVLTTGAAVFALLVVTGSAGVLGVLLAFLAVLLAYVAPDAVLQGRAKERQQRIELELPDTLDQVTISIEAGLGFEAALSRSAEQGTGPLAAELLRTIQDMRVGMSRRDAYQALIDRTTVDDLRRFAKSIIQAEEYGIPVSGVVRTQAKEMRVKRRLRAAARAQQVPVKLLFPLMACIFPVLFIIVLAPAVFNASDMFG